MHHNVFDGAIVKHIGLKNLLIFGNLERIIFYLFFMLDKTSLLEILSNGKFTRQIEHFLDFENNESRCQQYF